MTDYTPDNEEIREMYWACSGEPRRDSGAWDEFDRWLAAHDAQVLRDAANKFAEGAWVGAFIEVDDDVSAVQATDRWLNAEADRIEKGNT